MTQSFIFTEYSFNVFCSGSPKKHTSYWGMEHTHSANHLQTLLSHCQEYLVLTDSNTAF